MKYLKILFLGMVVIGIFAAPDYAVNLLNRNGNAFSASSTTNAYKIALEVYSNSSGVSTIADAPPSRGLIEVALTQNLNVGDTVNLTITNGSADFNSAGPGFKFGLCDVALGGNVAACDPGEIVAVVPPSGATLSNLGFSVLVPITAPRTLWVVQFDDTNSDNQYTAGEILLNGVGLFVHGGLNPSCSSFPTVKMGFSTPHETLASPVNFAVITPQFTGTGPGGNNLTAELDTDADFTQFVLGSGPDVAYHHFIHENNFITVTDNATDLSMWIAFAINPPGTISFDVNTVVGEPNIDFIEFAEVDCSANSNSTVFHCTNAFSAGNLVGPHDLELYVDGTSSLDPTNWTISNFNLANFCVTVSNRSIGVWYGGLEAFVPFVKGTVDRSYQTYIKLFNRYSNNAKVFVSTFADVPGGSPAPIMVSTAQLPPPNDMIPAGGFITVTDQDIGAFVSGYDMSKGLPVKFNIRVPSQIGTTTSVGSWYATYSLGGPTQATLTHQNPYDPFVEGIVVSIVPGGGQRSIPLKFKNFKNGEYNH